MAEILDNDFVPLVSPRALETAKTLWSFSCFEHWPLEKGTYITMTITESGVPSYSTCVFVRLNIGHFPLQNNPRYVNQL